ncbi:MAG: spermidine/putrescine ABC transporter substrate-binding protein [Verrucomicrobiae bacterium]|nr:spermidine/putrescine ABC transporter substrate-binding protein [Verrucomicrobiae bacterium]
MSIFYMEGRQTILKLLNGLRLMTLIVAIASLAGCLKENTPEAQVDPKRHFRPKAGSQELEGGDECEILSILTWSNYFVPSVIHQFENEFGCQIEVTEVGNSAQMMQAFESDPVAFDIVVADDRTFSHFLNLHLLAELDHDRISQLKEISTEFKGLYFDPENGYSVPYLWGSTMLACRSDKVEVIDSSWEMLWRSDLKGKIAMIDEPEDLFFITLMSMGVDPYYSTEVEIAEARRRLLDAFVRQNGKMLDFSSGLNSLESGLNDLAITYSGDAALRAEANGSIVVVCPKEGCPIWVDSFGISKETSDSVLCHQFIDFMCRPEVAAETANKLCYSSPNEGAKKMIEPGLLENRALYPEKKMMVKSRFIRFSKTSEIFVKNEIKRLFGELRSQGVSPNGEVALSSGAQ